MTALTCALVIAARKQYPHLYDQPLDIFRGVCEGAALLLIGYYGINELNQLRMWAVVIVERERVWMSCVDTWKFTKNVFYASHKLHYFLDYYNYLDASAVIFTFLIIPFRAIGSDVQWIFAALSYLFNGLRAFKYAAVFRLVRIVAVNFSALSKTIIQFFNLHDSISTALSHPLRSTGAYVQILYQVMLQDMIQFGTIFLVFLVSFSGAFYFALRGEVRSTGAPVLVPFSGNDSFGNESNTTTMSSQSATFTTSLNIYPFETL